MPKNHRVLQFTNSSKKVTTIYLEPWAEEFCLEPNHQIAVYDTQSKETIEHEICDNGISVFGVTENYSVTIERVSK